MEDDLVCEYDSTWDTESDGDELGENTARRSSQDKNKKARAGFWSNSSSRNLRAAKDMQNYRHGYPNIIEEECPEERMRNLKFYLNEIKSSPDDVSIETFHSEWRTDYKRLERVHSYIQWLFPLREPGVNYMASELTKKEIQAFRENEEARRRLVDSYELMLGFYGIQLVDRETGEVRRADNWRDRFANLERNMHNNLRITRMLKSLGELGFERFQAPLVHFFLEETLVRKNLSSVKRSVLDYFLFAVRDKRERRKLIRYAFQNFEPKDKFVWCPRRVQKRFKKKAEKRQDSSVGNGQPTEENRWHGAGKESERESKAIEVQKEEDEDDLMSVDVEKQLEGTSVDPEPNLEGSSVDPTSLNDSSSVDNGETDHTSATEPGIAKVQYGTEEEEGAEISQTAQDGDPADAQTEATFKPSDDSSESKSDDGERSSDSCSPEPSGLRDNGAGSPKRVLPCAEPGQRADKLPRTEAVAGPDCTETSGGSVSLRQNRGGAAPPRAKQSNGPEMMDTEASVGGMGGS